MAPIPPAERARLRKHSEDVLYEFQMFGFLGASFENRDFDNAVKHLARDGRPFRNAVIESFAVHTRQVVDFLGSRRKFASDLAAEDFAGVGWRPRLGTRLDWIRLSQRVNKEVAHLTADRAHMVDVARRWPTRMIIGELSEAIHDFAETAAARGTLAEGFLLEAQAALPPRRWIEGYERWTLLIPGSQHIGGTATAGLR